VEAAEAAERAGGRKRNGPEAKKLPPTAGVVIRELPSVVVERRPPRTSISARSVESLVGLLRLRMIMRKEQDTR